VQVIAVLFLYVFSIFCGIVTKFLFHSLFFIVCFYWSFIMDVSTGFLLVVMAVTQSGEGTSITTVPTVYETRQACESNIKQVSLKGTGGFGLRLESYATCITAGKKPL